MPRAKVFIDFDSTIFDAGGFKKVLFDALEEAGAGRVDVEETYAMVCKDYVYSPKKHIKALVRRTEIDAGEANYLLKEGFKKTGDFIYPDAVEFLKKIDHNVYEVNLLSLGDTDFQGEKIKSSGVARYFKNIYITEEQKWLYLAGLVKADEYFIMIDDRGDTISNIAKQFPRSLAIEINRIGFPGDPLEPVVEYRNIVITNFSQLMNVIKKHAKLV